VGHDGNEVATGVEGDIEVDGPSRFLGFLDNPTLTAEALAPWGGYRTGDRGFLDADGHLVYRGRSKDIIRRGGVTIVPADLEAVIIRHPAVRDVAVVPLPDDRLGERACAAIIVHEGAAAPTLAQLSDFLEADGVSKYTWPEELIVLEDFPRTPSLKVVKRALAEQIIQLLPRQDNANHE
jgi:non-ribosomal peptide synthetase component E (peptide arylation enzyme)